MRYGSVFALCVVLVLGCSGDEPYDPDWGGEAYAAAGKPDGLIDIVQAMDFGDSVSGSVGREQLDLYSVTLTRNDRIELEMEVTSGDLNPHITLFAGTSTYVSSESWDRTGDTLQKVYLAPSTGRYLIAARAYRAEGAGDYTLRMECTGGPCNGEPNIPEPDDDFDSDMAADCITQARECAFVGMERYNGAVGEARAQRLFGDCLSEATTYDGLSCADACAFDNEATEQCDDIKASLPFYADQSEACLGELNECLEGCFDQSQYYGWDDEEYYGTAEYVCWSGFFHVSCDSYARGHASCGGTDYGENSWAECHVLCTATVGAFIDDLDTLCSEDLGCDHRCETADIPAAAEACGGITLGNADCIRRWLDSHDAWGCLEPFEDLLDAMR